MHEYLLVVPDLLLADEAAWAAAASRSRARLRFGPARPLRAGWRASIAGRLGRPDLEALALAEVVAAAILPHEAPGDPAARSGAWLATPLHLVAGLDRVHLPRDGLVELEPAERDELAADFAVALGGGRLALLPAGPEAFLVLGLDLEAAQTCDPVECLGGDLAQVQPAGPGAAPLRRLMSEIEMWLHDHPVNRRRAARGRRTLRALWLWGGTASPRPDVEGAGPAAGPLAQAGAAAPAALPQVFSGDPWVRAVARLAGARLAPEGARPDAAAIAAGDVLVTARLHAEDLPDLEAFEARYLDPALEALRGGRLGRLVLVGAERSVAVVAADRYRLWRPRRPWLTALAS